MHGMGTITIHQQLNSFKLLASCYKYRIAGNFRGRKLSRIGEKYDFHGENFSQIARFATRKDAIPPNFAEKTFANSHKTVKFTKVFSLESFPLYGIDLDVTKIEVSEKAGSCRGSIPGHLG